MVEIEIDGKTVQTEKGSMLIKAADDAGIYIPRFCYHKKLSIAANCRMCLVEVENSAKPLPACATPVAPGMKVFTQSEKTLAAQKSVMEFLLINHPLDCPICDQGGECELQDLSMEYGQGKSRFDQGKRSVADKDLGPLISSEMTRCIHCTRCVRFGDEIAGLRELGGIDRGEDMEIGTYIQKSLKSELSGNVIDLCPVGALTSKPYRFTARAWEMQQDPSIAIHDCLGSHIYVHTRGQQYTPDRQVMRVVPRENESINETWLSDRDRYSYQAVNSENRLLVPTIKTEAGREPVTLEVARNEAVSRLKQIIADFGADQVGALISPSATLEEMYLFQKWMRGLGVKNIDHRLQQTDMSDQASEALYPGLGFPIAELDELDVCLLIGSNIRHEQPIANYRLRKAAGAGAQIMSVNPIAYDTNFIYAENVVAAGLDFIRILAEIVKVLAEQTKQILPPAIVELTESVVVSPAAQNIANILLQPEGRKAILMGAYAANHPQASMVRLLAEAIAMVSGAQLGCLTQGANAAGAWLAGVLPHRGPGGEAIAASGVDACKMLETPLRAYVLFGVEPERDAAHASAALHTLKNADLVIVFSAFSGKHIQEYADIILPVGTFTEISGTYINAEGTWQQVGAIGSLIGEARQGWEVLKECALVEYGSVKEVRQEIETVLAQSPQRHTQNLADRAAAFDGHILEKTMRSQDKLYRIADWPLYQTDMVVRNAKALQSTTDGLSVVRINSQLVEKMSLKNASVVRVAQNGQSVTLPLVIDDRIPDGFVHIPAGVEETAGFGEAMGEIELSA